MHIELSVIIVSYNVKRHLCQCLHSLQVALRQWEDNSYEVIVVDNASTDESQAYVCEKFPQVYWLQNTTNKGFGVANNQAVAQAQGKFLLFLNPDTIVTPEVLREARAKMHSESHVGAIGTRMLNAEGVFLGESKRGFPTPLASFAKLTGAYRLFPHSRALNRYYMSWLSPNETHKVEILAGAFMYVRRTEKLDEEKYFDERFFMYGEDIDLSARIAHTHECWYLPTPILHYKGESAESNKPQSRRAFFEAMKLFQHKYRMTGGWLLSLAINATTLLDRLRGGQRHAPQEKPTNAILCVFSERPESMALPQSTKNGLRIDFFMPIPLEEDNLRSRILPYLQRKKKTTIHVVFALDAYTYSSVLQYLCSQEWADLQHAAREHDNKLAVAFATEQDTLLHSFR